MQLLLKHERNWSFDRLEREMALNLGYREFTRIGLEKVPDAKALAHIAQVLSVAPIELMQRYKKTDPGGREAVEEPSFDVSRAG